jgi:hypothetical protein
VKEDVKRGVKDVKESERDVKIVFEKDVKAHVSFLHRYDNRPDLPEDIAEFLGCVVDGVRPYEQGKQTKQTKQKRKRKKKKKKKKKEKKKKKSKWKRI